MAQTHFFNNKKRTRRTLFIILAALCVVVLGVQFWRWQRPHYKTMNLSGYHSSDAKLAYKGYVVTSKSDHLYLVNTYTGESTETFIRSNWVDSMLEENVIVYSSIDHKTGICRFNPDTTKIESNYLILNDGAMRIDPSLVKLGDTYFLSSTRIEGTVNRADYEEENGIYTIELYASTDLENWSFVTAIYSKDQNLEDVELNADDGVLRIIFEQESVDKGPSSIHCIESPDQGQTWINDTVLINNGADNEPASFYISDNEFWLFYSSDIKQPGTSYEGSQAFLARYTLDYDLDKITPLKTNYDSQVLLYQAIVENGTATLLYAHDYLGEDDLCLENMGFFQIQENTSE